MGRFSVKICVLVLVLCLGVVGVMCWNELALLRWLIPEDELALASGFGLQTADDKLQVGANVEMTGVILESKTIPSIQTEVTSVSETVVTTVFATTMAQQPNGSMKVLGRLYYPGKFFPREGYNVESVQTYIDTGKIALMYHPWDVTDGLGSYVAGHGSGVFHPMVWKLKVGDQVVVMDNNGVSYVYTITLKTVLSPADSKLSSIPGCGTLFEKESIMIQFCEGPNNVFCLGE